MIAFTRARRLRSQARLFAASDNRSRSTFITAVSGDAGFAAVASIFGSMLVFAGGFVAAWYAFRSKDEELRVKLVEIAVEILRADPKEDVAPAREWAIKVIQNNSGVDFSTEDYAALLHKPLWLGYADYGNNVGYTDYMNKSVLEKTAWEQAEKDNTLESYNNYLRQFATGPHIAEAKAKFRQLLETRQK